MENNEVEVEATRVDENLGIDKDEVAQKSKQERVKVEEPKKSFNLNISLDTLGILFSVASIVLLVLAKIFAVISVLVAVQVFYWLGAFALFGALSIFVIQIIKDKKVAFTPSVMMLALAIIGCVI